MDCGSPLPLSIPPGRHRETLTQAPRTLQHPYAPPGRTVVNPSPYPICHPIPCPRLGVIRRDLRRAPGLCGVPAPPSSRRNRESAFVPETDPQPADEHCVKPKSPKLSQLLWLVIRYWLLHTTTPPNPTSIGSRAAISSRPLRWTSLPDGRRLSPHRPTSKWCGIFRRDDSCGRPGRKLRPSGTWTSPRTAASTSPQPGSRTRTSSFGNPVRGLPSHPRRRLTSSPPRVKAISPRANAPQPAGFGVPLSAWINDLDLRVWDISGGRKLLGASNELLSELGLVDPFEFITEDDLIIASVN